jgi:hypothetical protein
MNTRIIFQILTIAFIVLFSEHNVNAGGFGVSPSQIISNNLLKGSVYEQTVTFVDSSDIFVGIKKIFSKI